MSLSCFQADALGLRSGLSRESWRRLGFAPPVVDASPKRPDPALGFARLALAVLELGVTLEFAARRRSGFQRGTSRFETDIEHRGETGLCKVHLNASGFAVLRESCKARDGGYELAVFHRAVSAGLDRPCRRSPRPKPASASRVL